MELNASRNVHVYNDSDFDHQEKFRSDTVRIKAKGYVTMDRGDAVLFRGQFYPPKFDKGGLQTSESYKRIRIEEIPEQIVSEAPKEEVLEQVCQACGFSAKTLAGLKAHIRAQHKDQMIDEDARDSL